MRNRGSNNIVLSRPQTYQGFETWFNALKMSAKMYTYIIMITVLIYVCMVLVIAYHLLGQDVIVGLIRWTFYSIKLVFSNRLTVGAFSDWFGLEIWPQISSPVGRAMILSTPVGVVVPGAIVFFRRRALMQSERIHVRGAKILTASELNKRIRRSGQKTSIPLGPIGMPMDAEVRHCFVVGKPGTGKTVLLSTVLNHLRLRNRGDRVIVYDFKGDYISKFFDPDRDILFDPLDQRCIGWTVFSDTSTRMDIDSCARSLIPDAIHADPFWNQAARDVLAGILHHCVASGNMSNRAIWQIASAAPEEMVRELSRTETAQQAVAYIRETSSKQTHSILSVLVQYAKVFELMTDGDFSIASWVKQQQGNGGWLFVTNHPDHRDTLRPILSLFIDVVSKQILSLDDDSNRRIFVFLDELGTLQQLSGIVQLLTLSRSRGGSVWIGIQDIGQIEKIYGREHRQAIVNACGNCVIFSVSDPETAQFLSNKLGETEFYETDHTYAMGVADNRDGVSLMGRRRTERLVLPSDITGLADLHAYITIAGYHPARCRMEYRGYPDICPRFVMRPELSLKSKPRNKVKTGLYETPDSGREVERKQQCEQQPKKPEQAQEQSHEHETIQGGGERTDIKIDYDLSEELEY